MLRFNVLPIKHRSVRWKDLEPGDMFTYELHGTGIFWTLLDVKQVIDTKKPWRVRLEFYCLSEFGIQSGYVPCNKCVNVILPD